MKTALTLILALAGATFAAQAQEIKGDAARGATLNATCIGCHGIAGYQASFPEVYRVPAISGQNDKYIIAALNAYKKGERKHPTMRAVAVSLTEQDIADLAAYYATHGGVPPATTAMRVRCTGCRPMGASTLPAAPTTPRTSAR